MMTDRERFENIRRFLVRVVEHDGPCYAALSPFTDKFFRVLLSPDMDLAFYQKSLPIVAKMSDEQIATPFRDQLVEVLEGRRIEPNDCEHCRAKYNLG
jgi:hypothetical protein